MRIIIAGSGAMGCLFGGMLANAGHDVFMLEKDSPRSQGIRQCGITIEGKGGARHIPLHSVSAHGSDAGTADLVLVLVKAYDTENAVREFMPSVRNHTLVLTLQNGLGNIEAIAGMLPQEQILAGTTAHGATLLGPGKVRHAGVGPTVLGPVVAESAHHAHTVQGIFQAAGIDTVVAADIYPVLWGKLLVNIGINALTAIMRVKNGMVGDNHHLREVMHRAVREGAAVAGRLAIALPYPDPVARAEEVCRATSQNISSMHQDIASGRRTEIDSINGIVVEHGARLGVPTPINRMLVDLIKSFELMKAS